MPGTIVVRVGRRTLGRREPGEVLDHRLEARPDRPGEGVTRGAQLRRVEHEAAVGQAAAVALVGARDGRLPAGPDLGQDRGARPHGRPGRRPRPDGRAARASGHGRIAGDRARSSRASRIAAVGDGAGALTRRSSRSAGRGSRRRRWPAAGGAATRPRPLHHRVDRDHARVRERDDRGLSRPGRIASSSGRRALGAFIIRYLRPRAAMTDASIVSIAAISSGRSSRRRGAADEDRLGREHVADRPQAVHRQGRAGRHEIHDRLRQAQPRRHLDRARQVMTSTSIRRSAKYRRVASGWAVATRRPARSAISCIGASAGTAAASRQWP